MAPTELSVDGLKALLLLEEGTRLNCVSRVARELVQLGLAMPGWGDDLVISEAGRRVARGSVRSEHVADLSSFVTMGGDVDPMAAPQSVLTLDQSTPGTDPAPIVLAEAPIAAAAGPRDRALRAAGVASGRTEIWPDARWVEEFINALAQEEALQDR